VPQFPLIMTFSEVIQLGDSTLRVDGDTKVLAEFRDGACFCSAVSAGGIEERGADLKEAYRAVRRTVRLVIEDCAHGTNADVFREAVRAVFSSLDPDAASAWQSALDAVRQGSKSPDYGVQNLPVKSADEIRPVSVTELPDGREMSEQILKAA